MIAVVCFAAACAAMQQNVVGWNEFSHFSQIRAFDHGTAIIDPYRHLSGDRAYYHGHYYSDKAPGLGLLMLPVYHVARSTGIIASTGAASVHLVEVFACVIPLLVMLLLVFWLVERHDPGHGAAVALTLGLGTLLLPFATLLFSHVLSASLGFAAFYLLWIERTRGGRVELIAGAGLLAGYAISTEYPLALLAVLLGLFVLWRRRPLPAGLVYSAGVLVGLIPLFAYDWWAFGSPFHLSYSYVAANSSGVLGLGAPSVRNAVRLLVSDRGLLVVTPVVAAGIAGIAILYREGRRLDALVSGAVVAAYFGYNACYYLPFGGGVPGPRFLITMLPFLALPMAAAYRKAPVTTLALGLLSAGTMVLATLTGPLLDTGLSRHVWLQRLQAGHFKVPTASVWLFALLALIALALALRVTPRPRVRRIDLELTVLGLGSWFAVSRAGPALLASDLSSGHVWGLAALVILGVALVATVTRLALGNQLALLAAVPVVALAVRSLDRTTLAICLVAASLALLVVLAGPWRPLSRGPQAVR
ncbi:MAG: hypothetical protein JO206_09800 [Solirubrobacterales bacterium]|nr:hypothetical protein [Solirubrobacterales bacterium]